MPTAPRLPRDFWFCLIATALVSAIGMTLIMEMAV